jgi:hypothetical protein
VCHGAARVRSVEVAIDRDVGGRRATQEHWLGTDEPSAGVVQTHLDAIQEFELTVIGDHQ